MSGHTPATPYLTHRVVLDVKRRLRLSARATRADALDGTVIVVSEEATDTTRMLHALAEPAEVSGRNFIGEPAFENFLRCVFRWAALAVLRDRDEVPSDPDEREALVRSAAEELYDDLLLHVVNLIDGAAEELREEEERASPLAPCGPTLFQMTARISGERSEGVVVAYDRDERAYVLPRPGEHGVGPMIAVGEVREAEGVLRMGPPTLVSVYDDEERVQVVGADLDLHVGGLLRCLEDRDIAGPLPLPFSLPADPTLRDPATGDPIGEETPAEPVAGE